MRLLRISLDLSLAIFFTSPMAILISSSLEFPSRLSSPSRMAVALFSLAQMMKVKPNLSLYSALWLRSLRTWSEVRRWRPASRCSRADSGVRRFSEARRPARSGWPLRMPTWV